MKIQLPKEVKQIIEVLETHRYHAYAVGGCVRDSLIGRTPGDYDITTDAKPADVKKLFRKTVDTGIQHGTVTVMLNRTGYEVTTYRIDGEYEDSRHPKEVVFTPELSEDLRRRDFTINAMAYNDTDGLQDLFGGQEDLERGIIRAVGVPEERFTEDALRIMRCVRFASQLGFSIEPETYRAAGRLSKNLKNISRERVREELFKILLSDHPDYTEKLFEIGALDWYPEYEENRVAILRDFARMKKEPVLRLCAFLQEPDLAERILRELRSDNETRERTVHVLSAKDRRLSSDRREIRKAVHEIGKPYFADFLTFTGQEELRPVYDDILKNGECVSLQELSVSGGDLIALGMKPGKKMGLLLNELLLLAIDAPEKNTKEFLLEQAAELLKDPEYL